MIGQMIGQTVEIKIQFGLDEKIIKATVIQYLGNGEYVVEAENGNRYIRVLEAMNAETGHNNPNL